MATKIFYVLIDRYSGKREIVAETDSYGEVLQLQKDYIERNNGECDTKIEYNFINNETLEEKANRIKAEKAEALRYKKSALTRLGCRAIQQGIEEIMEACDDVEWIFSGENKEAVYEVLEEAYQDYDDFRNAFKTISFDAERLYEQLNEIWGDYPEEDFERHFDDCTVALIGNRFQIEGYDIVEEDYFNLTQYDSDLAISEAGKRLMRLTKKEMLSTIGQCMGIMLAYYDLRQQYDYLKATFDLLRGENTSVIQLVRKIEEAYEKTAKVEFYEYDRETREFDKLVCQLPDIAWIS